MTEAAEIAAQLTERQREVVKYGKYSIKNWWVVAELDKMGLITWVERKWPEDGYEAHPNRLALDVCAVLQEKG